MLRITWFLFCQNNLWANQKEYLGLFSIWFWVISVPGWAKTSLELRKLAYHITSNNSNYFDRFQLKLDIFRMYTANRPVLPCVKDEARPPSVLPTPYVVFCQETQSNQMGCGTVFNYCPAAPRFDTSSVERHQGLANLGMNTSVLFLIFNVLGMTSTWSMKCTIWILNYFLSKLSLNQSNGVGAMSIRVVEFSNGGIQN